MENRIEGTEQWIEDGNLFEVTPNMKKGCYDLFINGNLLPRTFQGKGRAIRFLKRRANTLEEQHKLMEELLKDFLKEKPSKHYCEYECLDAIQTKIKNYFLKQSWNAEMEGYLKKYGKPLDNVS